MVTIVVVGCNDTDGGCDADDRGAGCSNPDGDAGGCDGDGDGDQPEQPQC